MKLKIKNFGPISGLKIELKPMTVVIGRNNTGKSFFTQLIYSLLSVSEAFKERAGIFYRHFLIEYYGGTRQAIEQLRKISRQIKLEKPDEKTLFNLLLHEVLNRYSNLIQSYLQLSLERSFGVRIDKLVNVLARKSRIEWEYSSNIQIVIEITKQGKMSVRVKPNQKTIVELEDKTRALIHKTRKARTRTPELLSQVFFEMERVLFRMPGRPELIRRPKQAFYIPAGRAGLVESYDTVVSALISLSPIAPVKGLSMPPLPGMAAQFYDTLLQLKGHKGPFKALISDSFKKLFGGDIILRRVEQKGKSRLIYIFEAEGVTHSIDIIHAASMIKELAPIYLIIRELVQQGDFLLIEEPESHLHPGAQLDLVNVIAALVNRGVNFCITTHSDILLRRITHLIGQHQLKRDDFSLDPSKVSIYWLKEGKFGSESMELKISKRGILESIPTFDKVIEDLYKEELELQKRL